MSQPSVDELVRFSKEVFRRLVKNDDALTKQEVLEILGKDNHEHYSLVVGALADAEKITKKSGRTGGIEFKPGQARQRKLVPKNLRALEAYFQAADISESEIPDTGTMDDDKEKGLYEPLRRYLEKSGLYTIVEVIGNDRSGGGKWKNPDVVALNYSPRLKYHAGIHPKLTAFEVKYHWPTITALQQAASYLRFCHATYLCFRDSAYTGKKFDKLSARLRDDEIWEWASVYNVGLIVAFNKQERSTAPDFHIVKEAPDVVLDPETVEQGISTYLSQDIQRELVDAVRRQLKAIT